VGGFVEHSALLEPRSPLEEAGYVALPTFSSSCNSLRERPGEKPEGSMEAPTTRAALEPSGLSTGVSQRELWELDNGGQSNIASFLQRAPVYPVVNGSRENTVQLNGSREKAISIVIFEISCRLHFSLSFAKCGASYVLFVMHLNCRRLDNHCLQK
jgi:hypothetical protein